MCVIYLGYLLLTNSVYEFFDYCLFSLIDFTDGNSFSSTNWSVVFYFVLIFLLLKFNNKYRFKNRDLIYILAFQVMAIPLFDFTHILIPAIPFMAFLVGSKCEKKIDGYLSLIIVTFYISFTILFTVINDAFIDSDVFYIKNSFLYGKRVSFNLSIVHEMMDNINKEYNGYKVYHLYQHAYLVKLEHNQTLDKYDLNLKGNLGYHGEDRCIEEIEDNCNRQACLIIIDHDVSDGSQISTKINNYVKNNYKHKKLIYNVDLYTNEKDDSLLEINSK